MEGGEAHWLHWYHEQLSGQYGQLEATMRAHKFDFVQIDLAIDNRSCKNESFRWRRSAMGVLINLPFGRTRVFQKVLASRFPIGPRRSTHELGADLPRAHRVESGGDGGDSRDRKASTWSTTLARRKGGCRCSNAKKDRGILRFCKTTTEY